MWGESSFRTGQSGRVGEVAAFEVRKHQPDLFAKLPVPADPFALDLAWTEITEDGLKDLARFKQLQALDLRGCRLAEAELAKGLAPHTQLRSLSLASAEVPNGVLKTIGQLKELRTLNLGGAWKLTDAGVKELSGA